MSKQDENKRTFEQVLGCNLDTVLYDDEDLTFEAKKDKCEHSKNELMLKGTDFEYCWKCEKNKT